MNSIRIYPVNMWIGESGHTEGHLRTKQEKVAIIYSRMDILNLIY